MFDVINDTENEIENYDILDDYLKFLVRKLELSNAIFDVIFVNNEEIHRINREYRNVDRVTDVISFALEDNLEESDIGYRILGSIYICVEKIKEQAILYNHSTLREMCFLVTHGLLHLLGYDHMEEEEEKEMFSLQEELLNEFNIKR